MNRESSQVRSLITKSERQNKPCRICGKIESVHPYGSFCKLSDSEPEELTELETLTLKVEELSRRVEHLEFLNPRV